MLFITYDPYSDINCDMNDVNESCIICHENDPFLLNYSTQPFYIVNCNCNFNIHYQCLDQYYNYNILHNQICKCIICRECYLLPSMNAPNYITKIAVLLFNFIKYYTYLILKYFLLASYYYVSLNLLFYFIVNYTNNFIITLSGITILFSLYYNSQIFIIIHPRYHD
jgi:hypothetical protein